MKIGQRYSNNHYNKIIEVVSLLPVRIKTIAFTNSKGKIASGNTLHNIFHSSEENIISSFSLVRGQDAE